jgi:putative ABC transport system permease protein
MLTLFQIGFRSLLQHKLRSLVLGSLVTLVTVIFILLTGISKGALDTLVRSSTTLMTGHLNVGGFYKVTAGASAPVVTHYKQVLELVKAQVPYFDYAVERGRGWARVANDTGGMQLGLAGIDITQESGFKKVIEVESGSLDDLAKPDSLLMFATQAKKLGVAVGDKLTISAPTLRGTNNTVDVTVVAIAKNVGFLSNFNCFLNGNTLRRLYQLNDDTTGAIQIYLTDLTKLPEAEAALRKAIETAQIPDLVGLMAKDPRPFWEKFEIVNREDWTRQKIDVTTWEDEIAFVRFSVMALAGLSVVMTIAMVVLICVGMMNVMWVSIRERTREIGTLRAIGMQRRRVLMMFVIEAFVLGLISTLTGVLLGVALAMLLTANQVALPEAVQLFLLSEHLVVTPSVTWAIAAIVMITGCIAAISVIPSFLAARMKPITAMHHIG